MSIWNHIDQTLANKNQLYLLTVIESSGSAPGRRGFMMMVDEKDNLFGSIGGGIMEYKLVEKAKQLLKCSQLKSFCIKQVHRGDAHASSGMICSGEQTIAFTPITHADKALISKCAESDVIQISETGIKAIPNSEEEICQIVSESQWTYTQKQNKSIRIHLFGAGHVSVPTCDLLRKLGYQVYLYDNRSDINTLIENNQVFSKQIIDYADVNNQVEFHQSDYVVLMTHKFVEDKLILSQLLDLNFAYLGVLGSKNKIAVMFNALLKEGHKQTDLDKVYAPIGVDIHSKTTTEIAVSIVAEIIKVKNS